MFCDGDEVALVELKVGGEHSGQLPHAVQELDEGRRHLLGVALDVAAPVHELVAETQPVFLDQSLQEQRNQTNQQGLFLLRSISTV